MGWDDFISSAGSFLSNALTGGGGNNNNNNNNGGGGWLTSMFNVAIPGILQGWSQSGTNEATARENELQRQFQASQSALEQKAAMDRLLAQIAGQQQAAGQSNKMDPEYLRIQRLKAALDGALQAAQLKQNSIGGFLRALGK
jgi:hypothetical protein